MNVYVWWNALCWFEWFWEFNDQWLNSKVFNCSLNCSNLRARSHSRTLTEAMCIGQICIHKLIICTTTSKTRKLCGGNDSNKSNSFDWFFCTFVLCNNIIYFNTCEFLCRTKSKPHTHTHKLLDAMKRSRYQKNVFVWLCLFVHWKWIEHIKMIHRCISYCSKIHCKPISIPLSSNFLCRLI